MLRSMYSGISGMKGFQTDLDTIGNNIANVNTSGFKKGRVTFQDLMSQTTAGAQGASNTRGGTNAQQVGLGSKVGNIDTTHTQGSRQTTDNPLDLELEGDGMFVLADGLDKNTTDFNLDDADVSYSRAGNFYLDDQGHIVNPNGQYLVGFGANNDNSKVNTDQATLLQIPEGAEDFSISQDGTVSYVEDGDKKIAGQVALANFSNPEGLEKMGNSLYRDTTNAGGIENGAVGGNLHQPDSTSVVSGALEMSNVDLSDELTNMITAQRGFQANTRIITTSDDILQELVNLKR